MMRIIIYLDGLLTLGNSMSEIFTARDSVIFLLQHLDFEINLKKCVRSCTRIRVLRADCEFPNYEFVITRGKYGEDKGSMPEFIQSIRGITSGFDKTNRNNFFNHSSNAPSPSTVSLLATTANSIPKTNTV